SWIHHCKDQGAMVKRFGAIWKKIGETRNGNRTSLKWFFVVESVQTWHEPVQMFPGTENVHLRAYEPVHAMREPVHKFQVAFL
ncbi:hypothetical protein A2U01_0014619, partial [Trifolium medium]|nr:hypothetical protein [Trifolium medium]